MDASDLSSCKKPDTQVRSLTAKQRREWGRHCCISGNMSSGNSCRIAVSARTNGDYNFHYQIRVT